MNNRYLSRKERDAIMDTLTPEQRTFLANGVKRGKRTAFANVLAKKKGISITENMSIDEIEQLLSEWVLVDYIDGGPGYRNREPLLTCQCGKVLRYQYVVKHLSTGDIRRFGETHLQEHTGIPPQTVNEIIKGFNKIDYELDEILLKIKKGWQLDTQLPVSFEVPKDIKEHLDLNLPLLDRQIIRLESKLSYFHKPVTKMYTPTSGRNYPTNQASFGSMSLNTQITGMLSEDLKQAILRYLMNGAKSARMICELLIKQHGAPKKRMISGKPEIYTHVCEFIEKELGCKLIQTGLDDRGYQYEGETYGS